MTLLIQAGLALPAWDAPTQTDFAVLVDGSWIVDAGEASALRARYPQATSFDTPEAVLLPAMVNSHDHGRGLGSLQLGVPDDLLEVWLLGLAEQPVLDPYLAALYDGLRQVRSGVSLVLHSHNLRDADHADSEVQATLRGYRDAGIRVAFDMPVVDQSRALYEEPGRTTFSRAAYFDLCADLVRTVHDPSNHKVTLCVGPSGPQWATDELMTECVTFAQRHDLRMHVHGLETWYQRQYAVRRWGKSLVQHLDDIGLLGPWLTLAHMIWTEPQDLPLLAERGVGVAHNPSSNLRLRSGVAPVAQLLEAGITVGIGLDGQTLDDDQDFLREVRLAWTLGNRPGAAAPSLSLAAVRQMATCSGAAITLGAGAPLGKLAPGYLADLVLVSRGSGLDDWTLGLAAGASLGAQRAMLPELLFRSASRRHVQHVMIDGQWVVRDGHSTQVDEADVVVQLRECLARQQRNSLPDSTAAQVRAYYADWGTPSES